MHSTRAFVAFVALALGGCEQLLTSPTPYGTVRVEARSRGGAPIPGVRAELYTSFRPMGYEVTNDSGRTVFARVPKAQYGVVLTVPAGYALVSTIIGGAVGERIDGLNIEAGADTTLRFTFARLGNGVIEAEVKDQEGTLLAGQLVTLYRGPTVLGSVRSDALGIARFANVAFGQYGLFLTPPDSLGVRGAATIFRDGVPVDAEVVARPVFVVTRCVGTIRPRVIDQDSLPVPGMPVTLYSGAGNRASGTTDSQGRVTFTGVPCDNWGVFANGIAGYNVTWARGFAFQDGLALTHRATLEPTLRATRQ